MADVFFQKDVGNLLINRNILLIGDSNLRSQYKDLIWIFNNNSLIDYKALRKRLENSYHGDTLISKSELTKGRNFREHRLYKMGGLTIEFLFVTRCINENVRKIFKDIKQGNRRAPDVVLMNSCLWDLTRWGPNGPSEYQDNMRELMQLLKSTLPLSTMVLWATPPPLASKISASLLIKQIEFLQETLRFEILIAGKFIQKLVSSHGYDLIDFHYYLKFQTHRRSCDGVHYLPIPVRMMTNILLTHLSLCWGRPLPGNVTSPLLEEEILKIQSETSQKTYPLNTRNTAHPKRLMDLPLSYAKYWSPLLSASSYKLPSPYNPRRRNFELQALPDLIEVPQPWSIQNLPGLNQNHAAYPGNRAKFYLDDFGPTQNTVVPAVSRVPVIPLCNTPTTGRKCETRKAFRKRNLTEARYNYKPYNRGHR